jgi:AcrR family transcriptional regulator
MPVAARGGLGSLALETVAARAGVTRNLLYHYFPRGRRDLEIAVVGEAERQLDLTSLGEGDPLPRLLEHALAPTHAWRIHRWAVACADPDIRHIAAQAADQLALKLSGLHLATADPEPLLITALRGYVAFAETALDSGRAMALARPALLELLSRTLAATLDAARG